MDASIEGKLYGLHRRGTRLCCRRFSRLRFQHSLRQRQEAFVRPPQLRYSLPLTRGMPHEHPPKLHSLPCGQHQLPPTHRKSPVGQQPVSPEALSSQMYPSGQSGTQPIGQHSSLVTKFTERLRGSAAEPGVLGSGSIVTAVVTKIGQDKIKNAKRIVVIDGFDDT